MSPDTCQTLCTQDVKCSFYALMGDWCYIYDASAEGSICEESTHGQHYKQAFPCPVLPASTVLQVDAGTSTVESDTVHVLNITQFTISSTSFIMIRTCWITIPDIDILFL